MRIFEKLDFDNKGEARFEDYEFDIVKVMDTIGEHTPLNIYDKILLEMAVPILASSWSGDT